MILEEQCLTNWFAAGLSEFDVMNMAGHSSFETTRQFYLAVRNDLLDRARETSTKAMSKNFCCKSVAASFFG